MYSKKYHCSTVSQYTETNASGMSKSKKIKTKKNLSQAGIKDLVGNISNVVGYSNVISFLEHDALGNMTIDANSIIKHNKDTYGRHGYTNIDVDAINIDAKNYVDNDNDDDDDDDEGNDHDNDGDSDAETDSLASMETLSDNVAIWVNGERHWISGVDANTTCMDLICALLNYQNGQQMFKDDGRDQNTIQPANSEDILNDYHDRNKDTTENPNNNCNIGGNNTINQSMPTKETKKEREKTAVNQGIHNDGKRNIRTSAKASLLLERNIALAAEYAIVKKHRHYEEYLDGNAKVFDVLSVKADSGGVGVGVGVSFGDDGTDEMLLNRKECELFLRRLVNTTAMKTVGHIGTFSVKQHAGNTQVASLLSTDKDSGMGSPVGSSRSARFRRRKHKSATWLSQGNTLHPKAAQRGNGFSAVAAVAIASTGNNNIDNVTNVANERLMRIILAQDETIHRQLSLLREKERQISKIEEEKHRVRERELGKNYLLETYFRGLDEAAAFDPDDGDGDVEIFVDEPHQLNPKNSNEIIVETVTGESTKQQRSSRQKHDKKLNKIQQSSCQLMNKDSTSDTVKENNIAAVTSDVIVTDNQNEIELQISWLEKVYALNKQLQREEETLLKLHAKIRKHQVRCAYQMKNDVLEQIDKLDAKLALQCANICRIEDNLIMSEEQLKVKLNLLEKLHVESEGIHEVIDNKLSMHDDIYCQEKSLQNCDQIEIQSKLLKADDISKIQIDKNDDPELKSQKRKPIVDPCNSVEPIIAAHNVVMECMDDIEQQQKPKLKEQHTQEQEQQYQKIFDDDESCRPPITMSNMTNAKATDPTIEFVSTVGISSFLPMTKLTVMHSSMLNQKQQHLQHQQEQCEIQKHPQQQQQQQHHHHCHQNQQHQQHQQHEHHNHNQTIIRSNQLEPSLAISTDMQTENNGNGKDPMMTDKNILPQFASNTKIIKKPIYEVLSLKQMTPMPSIAVAFPQKISPNKSAVPISSSALPLKDSNGIDLSQLGTLV